MAQINCKIFDNNIMISVKHGQSNDKFETLVPSTHLFVLPIHNYTDLSKTNVVIK